MKKTILAIFLLFSLLPLAACSLGGGSPMTVQNSAVDASTPNPASTTVATNTPTASDAKKVQKFYPEPLVSQGDPSISAVAKNNSSDPMPDNLEIKIYLVDKYNPGTCYGMPTPVPEEAISGMIARNQSLANLVRTKYKLKSNLDIYLKIKQIFGIQLAPISGGKYKYDFTDGQCCSLKYYSGEIQNIGGKILDSVTDQQTKNNPC